MASRRGRPELLIKSNQAGANQSTIGQSGRDREKLGLAIEQCETRGDKVGLGYG